MESLSQAIVKSADGTEMPAGKLWESAPAIVMIVRRPGCVLCRAEAKKLWALHERAQALGVNMVAVVHEWRDQEIAAFAPEFWGGPVYHDTTKAFYKAINGGQLLHGSAVGLLNPFGAVWKRIKEARKEVSNHNVVGEGLIMGGCLVVGAQGTGPYFVHAERTLGQHPDHTHVMEAAEEAAAVASGKAQPPQAAATPSGAEQPQVQEVAAQ